MTQLEFGIPKTPCISCKYANVALWDEPCDECRNGSKYEPTSNNLKNEQNDSGIKN
jgi:hypothetical protein